MRHDIYVFSFNESIPIVEIESLLVMAIIGTEALHGHAVARLDVGHYLDPEGRKCVIDAYTPAGGDLCRLFVGFLTRTFGESAFTVRPVSSNSPTTQNKGNGVGCPRPSQN